MRALLIVLATLLFFAVVYWTGLIAHFPGARMARYLENRFNRSPRIVVRLSPLELKWNRIAVSSVSVETPVDGQPRPVVAFHDAEIPLSLGLINGVSLRAAIGEGATLTGYWPWSPGEARIEAAGLRLENLPALALLDGAEVQGEVGFSATLATGLESEGTLPAGRLRGRAERINLAKLQVMGIALPATAEEEIAFQLKLGRTITVEEATLRGDVQGSLSGTLTPALDYPERSVMQLTLDLAFRPEWIERWGPLKPLVEAALQEGHLRGALAGTPQRPLFRPLSPR